MPINDLVPYLRSPHLHERLYAKQALFYMDNKVRREWEGRRHISFGGPSDWVRFGLSDPLP
jgi:hypothetical protein